MDEIQATVQFRQVEFIDKRTGRPNRVFINPENYAKFLNGEDGISGLDNCPTQPRSIRVRDLDAKDLKLTGEVEPDSVMEHLLSAIDQVCR